MPRRLSLAGLILMVVIWSGVLLTPKLRLLLRSQLHAQPLSQWVLSFLPLDETPLKTLAQRHPNDPRILAAQIEDLSDADLSEDYRKQQLREYDALIEKFPREKWLIQNRLRLSVLGGLAIDTGEMQAQSMRDTHSNYSRAEILQALKMAERGARLDPQNSFYDWMRAIFLFALHRDEAALRALQQGARKTNYDDGVLRDMQIRDAVRTLQSPQLWEDRVSVNSAFLLPHYAKMRRANLAAIWQGTLAERAGNHARALEIYGAQMKLSQMMWRHATPLIGTLVARAMADEVWNSPPRKQERKDVLPPGASSAQKLLQHVEGFADYARAYGRGDLAKEALRDARLFHSDDNQRDAYFETAGMGTSYELLRYLVSLQWFNSLLARAVIWSTLACLLLGGALLLVPGRAHRIQVAVLDVASSVAFVIVPCLVPIFGIYLAVFYAPAKENIWVFMLPMQLEVSVGNYGPLLPLTNTYFGVMPLALSGFYCCLVLLWRARRSIPMPAEDDLELQRAGRILFGIGMVLLLIAMTVWFWNFIATQNLPDVIALLGLAAPLFFVMWVLYRLRRNGLKARSANSMIYFFAWCRSTLGALAVLGSITYFICALAALPVRREANAQFDDYLRRGETALVRDISQTQP
jgi:hypothetical protein